ncbi:MAG: hypothetical protein ACPLUL_11290, partial [Thermanaerothrix sp.]|uniref:hypothetical protein n=1 Tax=Thermanaerothrix sp. TaxID=2972675 RepID=UPI003C7B3B6A
MGAAHGIGKGHERQLLAWVEQVAPGVQAIVLHGKSAFGAAPFSCRSRLIRHGFHTPGGAQLLTLFLQGGCGGAVGGQVGGG